MVYNILSLTLGCFAWVAAIAAIHARSPRIANRLSAGRAALCTV